MDIFSNQYNYGQNFPQNNEGQNLYIENNNLYQYNNNTLNNNFLNFSDMNQKNPSNNVQRKPNNFRNSHVPDERLILFLKYLGLSNYIANFQRNGTSFEDFLAFNRKDFNLRKIPKNVQEILENSIIDYVKVGSLYTKDEINLFFRRRNQKRQLLNNANMMGNMGNNLRAPQPMNNNWDMENNQVKVKQRNYKNNLYNQQRNNRARSQSSKQINYKQLLDNNMNLPYGNNYGIINNQNMDNNNNNIEYQYYSNNIKKSNNMIRQNKANKTANINKKKNLINNSSNNNNNYNSSNSNMNIYSPSVDNFSHLAIEENSSNLDNLKKMAKFRDMNNCNYNNLKRNLSSDVNFNEPNELINNPNNANNNSSGKSNIIQQMDKVLQRIQTRKENIYASTQTSNHHHHNFRENSINVNINKGYHSDGYLNEQKKIDHYNNIIKSNKNNNSGYKTLKNNNYSYNNNNLKLNGYEINSYYTGDTSQFDSLRGESNNVTPVIKKIRGKTGKMLYYSKMNKIIKDEQMKNIEHILGYGALSVTPKTPLNYNDKVFNTRGNSFNSKKGMSMYNFDIYNNNNEDEIDLNKNNSKSNLTNYTYGYNNNYVKPFNMNVNKNQNYQLFSRKNNNNVATQKNTLVQNRISQKQSNKNKYNNSKIFNNFNNYSNNKGNLSTNLNNNNNQGIKINSNIININSNNNKNKSKNQNNRPNSHYGPVQIQIKNGRKLNDNNNNNYNMNQNFNKRTNNFMSNNPNNTFNNQSSTNFSVGRTGNNYNDIMTNNYFNSIINVNNARAMKRNAKSLEKYREHLNIGIYPGIHNINNNINNININNINYDGKALSNGFNNFMGINKEMNYQTSNNFYQPNDLNEGIYFDEII